MGIYELGQIIGILLIVAPPIVGFSFRFGWLAADYLVDQLAGLIECLKRTPNRENPG